MTLGEKIIKYREKVCMSREDFASRLGLNDPTRVQQWEENVSCPDLLLLDEMTKIFDVSKNWYVANDDVSFHDYLDDVLEARELITYIAFHGDRVFFEEAIQTLRRLKTDVLETNKKKQKKT
jgi:transcriptional regulator with XRE-family HTH domain